MLRTWCLLLLVGDVAGLVVPGPQPARTVQGRPRVTPRMEFGDAFYSASMPLERTAVAGPSLTARAARTHCLSSVPLLCSSNRRPLLAPHSSSGYSAHAPHATLTHTLTLTLTLALMQWATTTPRSTARSPATPSCLRRATPGSLPCPRGGPR